MWFNSTRMHVFTHLKKESLGKTGGAIAVYEPAPDERFHQCLRPEDAANRSDVRWMKVTDGSGRGIEIRGEEPFGMVICRSVLVVDDSWHQRERWEAFHATQQDVQRRCRYNRGGDGVA